MRTTAGAVAKGVLKAMSLARLKASILSAVAIGALAMAGVGYLLPIDKAPSSQPQAGGRSQVVPADEPKKRDPQEVKRAERNRLVDQQDQLPGVLPGPSIGEVEALLRTIGRDPVTPDLIDRAASLFRPRARQSGNFEAVRRRVTEPEFVGRIDAIMRSRFGKAADSLTLIEQADHYHVGRDDAIMRKQVREAIERRAIQPLAIRGIVFDEKNGRMLPGAEVSTRGALARTDETGAFTLSCPRPNEPFVRIYFERAGYALNEVVIPVDEIPKTKDRRFGLLKQELIAGCVFDPEGKPISAAELELWTARSLVNRDGLDRLDVGRGNAVSLRTRTDDLGQFVFRGVPPRRQGRLRYSHLWVRHPRFQTFHESEPDRLGPGRLEDITLRPGCVATGLVVDDGGRPVQRGMGQRPFAV